MIRTAAQIEKWQRIAKLDYMSAEEAAFYINVGRTTFEGMVKSGRIKPSRPQGPNGVRRFLRERLDALMRDCVEAA